MYDMSLRKQLLSTGGGWGGLIKEDVTLVLSSHFHHICVRQIHDTHFARLTMSRSEEYQWPNSKLYTQPPAYAIIGIIFLASLVVALHFAPVTHWVTHSLELG